MGGLDLVSDVVMFEQVFSARTAEELRSLPIIDQWISLDEHYLTSSGELIFPMLIEATVLSEKYRPFDPPDNSLLTSIHYTYSVPRRKSILRIANVVDYDITRHTSRTDGTIVYRTVLKDNELTVTGARAIIRVKLSSPQITLTITDDRAEDLTYSVWFGIHSPQMEKDEESVR